MHLELPLLLRGPGIRVMESFRKTGALTLLPGLLESERWPLNQLEEYQEKLLVDLGRHCLDQVPWYQPIFQKAGLSGQNSLSSETLARLPLTTKDTIRQAGQEIHSTSFARWQPRSKKTSGSTGVPLKYYLDRPSHSYQWAHLWRGWSQVGYRPGDIYATLSGGSLVPEKPDVKHLIYMLLTGALHFPSTHLDDQAMAGYLRVLQTRRVHFLYGYPSSIEILAEFASRQGSPLPALRAVFTTSESLQPDSRKTIETAWGCPVLDTYGCNDGGLYSYECEHQGGFHVGMESVYVEVTDDEGNRLPDGETGQIVTTNLAMRAMPLLRYVTGDIGALDRTACPCGRGLLRIVSLQGRDRDFVLTPEGRKVHGAFFTRFPPFFEADWLKRFQIYQPELGVLIVRLIVHRTPHPEEKDHLIKGLQRGLGEMDVRLEIVEKMELTRTGKFRVIISDIS